MNTIRLFRDRQEAGDLLATRLLRYWGTQAAVLAIPRGGVAIGYEVAKKLRLPLDTIIVRKISSSHNPEFAVAAVAQEDSATMDTINMDRAEMTREDVEKKMIELKSDIENRKLRYRSGSYLANKNIDTIIIVDDGIATGLSMKTAIEATRRAYPGKEVLVAVPVCAKETAEELKLLCDKLVCLEEPDHLIAVGLWYTEFPQLTDDDVEKYLNRANRPAAESEKP